MSTITVSTSSPRFNPYSGVNAPSRTNPPTVAQNPPTTNSGLSPALVSVLEQMASEFVARRNAPGTVDASQLSGSVLAPNADLASAGLAPLSGNLPGSVMPPQIGSQSAHLMLQGLLAGHQALPPPVVPSAFGAPAAPLATPLPPPFADARRP